MKSKDLIDPRHSWFQKFLDQIEGAPQYTFTLSKEQLDTLYNGLMSIDDKGWRIKELLRKCDCSTSNPKTLNNNIYYLITFDITEYWISKNFITLDKSMCLDMIEGGFFITTRDRNPDLPTH